MMTVPIVSQQPGAQPGPEMEGTVYWSPLSPFIPVLGQTPLTSPDNGPGHPIPGPFFYHQSNKG